MKYAVTLLLLCAFVTTSAVAATGMIKVKADPEPATITIDGKRYQDATQEARVYELSPGRHVIRAEKQYYNSQQKTVTIRANEVAPTIIFKFEKSSGFKVDRPDQTTAGQGRGDLTIITDKPGATVTLNGRTVDADVTPITVRELGEGEWDVEVTLQGKKLRDVVLIHPEKLATVRFFFDKNKRAIFSKELAERKRQEKESERKRQAEELRTKINKHAEELRKKLKMVSRSSIRIRGSSNTSISKTKSGTRKSGGFWEKHKYFDESISTSGKKILWKVSDAQVSDVLGHTHTVSITYTADIKAERTGDIRSVQHGKGILGGYDTYSPSYSTDKTSRWQYTWDIVIDGKKLAKSIIATPSSNDTKWSVDLTWCNMHAYASKSFAPNNIKEGTVYIEAKLPQGSIENEVNLFRSSCLSAGKLPIELPKYIAIKRLR